MMVMMMKNAAVVVILIGIMNVCSGTTMMLIDVDTVHHINIPQTNVYNFTFNITTSSTYLRTHVYPCNSTDIQWLLIHIDTQTVLHTSSNDYVYTTSSTPSLGLYMLRITNTNVMYPAAIDICAFVSAFLDPYPYVKTSELEIHEVTESHVELEWVSTTSIAEDNRLYKIYNIPLSLVNTGHTACSITAEQHQPIATFNDNTISYEIVDLEADEEYKFVLIVENTVTGKASAYEPVTVKTLDHADEHHDDEESVTSIVWLNTMLAVILCSILSLSGILLLLWRRISLHHHIMMNLIGLAIGSLIGTVVFTLLPESSDIYGGIDVEISCIILAGLCCGYLLESVLHVHIQQRHHPLSSTTNNNDINMKPLPSSASTDVIMQKPSLQEEEENEDDDNGGVETIDISESKRDQFLSRAVLLSLIGDAIHNIIDGALIGASFIENTSAGISVTLAIFLHEIPQEMGDFCILLKAGWSSKASIIANLCIQLLSVVGAIIALSIGEKHENITNYFIPFACGMFIYLALGALLPELQKLNARQYIHAALFVCMGITIMGLLYVLTENTSIGSGHSHAHGSDGGDTHDHNDGH